MAEQTLLTGLPNFYRDFTFDDSALHLLLRTNEEVFQMFEDQILQTRNDMSISTMMAYRTFPFRTVNLAPLAYNLEQLLRDPQVVAALGLHNMTARERLVAWSQVASSNKSKILSDNNFFSAITARRVIDLAEPRIVEFAARDNVGHPLRFIEDIAVHESKLFLLSERAAALSKSSTKLNVEDIYVDYNSPENLVGRNIGMTYDGSVSKPEYRDFLQMVVYASLGGPTIGNIERALNSLADWSGVQVSDMYSAAGLKKAYWDGASGSSTLSPFDFLISIPLQHFSGEGKLALFNRFLKIIKPAYTNYLISWAHPVTSQVSALSVLSTKSGLSTRMVLPGTDSVDTRSAQTDVVPIEMIQGETLLVQFDSGDARVSFDAQVLHDRAYQLRLIPGTRGYGDEFGSKHVMFPEFPLQFSAARHIVTGDVAMTFRDNAQGATRYEVLRNGIIILTWASTGLGGTIALTDTTLNAQPPGNYTYFARTVFDPTPSDPAQRQFSSASRSVTIAR